MPYLQSFKLEGYAYKSAAAGEDLETFDDKPHGELIIRRTGTDAFQFQHMGKQVSLRGPDVQRLLYILTGWNADPSCTQSEGYRAADEGRAVQMKTRDEITREVVREEIAAVLSSPSFEPETDQAK